MDEIERDKDAASFVDQLKKRKVFRAAITYGVVAFVVVQLIDAVGDAIGLSAGAVRGLLGGLILGFPVVIAIAWYFEVSKPSIHLDDRFQKLRLNRVFETGFLAALFIGAAVLAVFVFRYSAPTTLVNTAFKLPSIAVLPFQNFGSNSTLLSHGLPDQLLTRLDKITEFNILSRTSSFSDRFKNKDMLHIGTALGADHIVEGSIQQDGDRILVTAQLINVPTGTHVWSETYDRNIENLLDVEIDIAQQIAKSLKVVLSTDSEAALRGASTNNSTAYRQNLQGWAYYWRPRSELSLQSAITLFEHAIAEDGKFQDPVVGKCISLLALYRITLNQAHFQSGNQTCLRVASGFHRTTDVLVALGDLNRAVGNDDIAEEHYLKALDNDNSRADTYEGLANVFSTRGDYAAAENYFKKAIAAPVTAPSIFRGYGFFLSMRGRYEDAAIQFEQVVTLAPDDGNAYSNLGLTYYLLDEWDKAENTWDRALAINRDVPVLYNLATLRYYQHRFEDAQLILEEVLQSRPDSFFTIGKLASVLRELGETEAATTGFRRALALGTPDGAIESDRIRNWLASYKANLGEFEQAQTLVQQTLQHTPENADAHYTHALVLCLEGRYEEARKAVSRAKEYGYSKRMIQADPVLTRALGAASS